MTEPVIVPAQTWRLIGRSPDDVPESYIPISGPRHLDFLRRIAEGPTPEERERWAKDAARAEAKRREALGRSIARHVALSDEHSGHPILSALLHDHAPHPVEVDGKQRAECHGCPTCWEHSEYEEWQKAHHEWPCPTWTTIAEQTKGDS